VPSVQMPRRNNRICRHLPLNFFSLRQMDAIHIRDGHSAKDRAILAFGVLGLRASETAACDAAWIIARHTAGVWC
jgi:hypothetical protein